MKRKNCYKLYIQMAWSLLLILFLATSCEKESETLPVIAHPISADTIQAGNAVFNIYTTGKPVVQGKGSVITKVLPLSGFTEIEVKKIGNIEISSGTEYRVSVSDYENLADFATFSMSGQRLIIGYADTCVKNSRLTIRITTPDPLYSIALSGIGNIDVKSPVDQLSEITLSGNGKIVFRSAVTSDDLYVDMEGVGYIYAYGLAKNLNVELGGSGSIDLTDLNAKTANCTISGVGDIRTTVTESLSALLAGTGNIIYFGNPDLVKNITGTGSIQPGQ